MGPRVREIFLDGRLVFNIFGEGGDVFEDAFEEQFGGDGIKVVLDYLWEQSADYHQKSSGKTP
jgi:hypothetical protein